MEESRQSNFLFYHGQDGKISVQLILGNENAWTNESGMAEIFGIDRTGISKHIKKIFEDGELSKEGNVQFLHIANSTKPVAFYSVDVIIAVGYRVNSYKATQFRIWSNKVLKEYLIKGFVLDDERLKQGNQLFGKDYFTELLERIKEIRASERMFYEKITDLYATSVDYDKNDPATHKFFAKVQNKVEFAIVKRTSAETIKSKANSLMPNMGLMTWKNLKKDGKIQKTDISIAKNYFNESEIKQLNSLVNMYLDYATLQVERNRIMKMSDWERKLDDFLRFNEFPVLTNYGNISKDVASRFAEKEYAKFKIIQDRDFKSDFDKFSTSIIQTGKAPVINNNVSLNTENQTDKESKTEKRIDKSLIPNLRDLNFDNTLKAVLSVPPPKKDKK